MPNQLSDLFDQIRNFDAEKHHLRTLIDMSAYNAVNDVIATTLLGITKDPNPDSQYWVSADGLRRGYHSVMIDNYVGDLSDAVRLGKKIAPDADYTLKKRGGVYQAKFGHSRCWEASTQAIAVCLAIVDFCRLRAKEAA